MKPRIHLKRQLDKREDRLQSSLQDIIADELNKLRLASYRKIRRINTVRKIYPLNTEDRIAKASTIGENPWDAFRTNMQHRLLEEIRAGVVDIFAISQAILTENPVDIDFEDFARSFESQIGQRITKVEQSIKDEVGHKIVDWYNRPGSKYGDIVGELSDTFGVERAARIAQNEITSLDSAVQEKLMDALGLDDWAWDTKRDQLVCTKKLKGPDGFLYEGCRGLHGKIFHRNDPKPPNGSHIGCRCKARPLSSRKKSELNTPNIVDISHLDKAEFVEGEHPRAHDGKFAPKGQGESHGATKKPSGESPQARPPIAPPDHPQVVAWRNEYYKKAYSKLKSYLEDKGIGTKAIEEAYDKDYVSDQDNYGNYKRFLINIQGELDDKRIDQSDYKKILEAIRVNDWRGIKNLKLEPMPVPVVQPKPDKPEESGWQPYGGIPNDFRITHPDSKPFNRIYAEVFENGPGNFELGIVDGPDFGYTQTFNSIDDAKSAGEKFINHRDKLLAMKFPNAKATMSDGDYIYKINDSGWGAVSKSKLDKVMVAIKLDPINATYNVLMYDQRNNYFTPEKTDEALDYKTAMKIGDKYMREKEKAEEDIAKGTHTKSFNPMPGRMTGEDFEKVMDEIRNIQGDHTKLYNDQAKAKDAAESKSAEWAKANLEMNRAFQANKDPQLIKDLDEKQQKLYTEFKELDAEYGKISEKIKAVKSQTRTDILRSIRDATGKDRCYVEPDLGTKKFKNKKNIDEAAMFLMNSVHQNALSNTHNPGHAAFKVNKARAHSRAFANSTGIHITENDDAATVVHEMGHILEMQNTQIFKAANEFLEKRTMGEPALPLRFVTGQGYSRDEMAKSDKFPHPYCGKIYASRSTEIISMGCEYMFEDPEKFHNDDPEYFQFIFDVMQGHYGTAK